MSRVESLPGFASPEGKKQKFGSTHDRGAWAELIACSWLLEKGFGVFRNVSGTGPADLVATLSGKCLLIDVKFTKIRNRADGSHQTTRGRNVLADAQQNSGIVQLNVTQDGICSFSITDLETMYDHAAARAMANAKQKY